MNKITEMDNRIDKLDAAYQRIFDQASRDQRNAYLWTRCDRIEYLLNTLINDRDDLIRRGA